MEERLSPSLTVYTLTAGGAVATGLGTGAGGVAVRTADGVGGTGVAVAVARRGVAVAGAATGATVARAAVAAGAALVGAGLGVGLSVGEGVASGVAEGDGVATAATPDGVAVSDTAGPPPLEEEAGATRDQGLKRASPTTMARARATSPSSLPLPRGSERFARRGSANSRAVTNQSQSG